MRGIDNDRGRNMSERQAVGHKLRFEVFKRDSFTCQYCGAKAPDVVLNVDHIHPVAEGGDADILNLVTSCRACNGGKGARLLSDDSVVERQRAQIEELEERRQQLEMMLQWRDSLRNLDDAEIDAIAARMLARTGIEPNDSGRAILRRLLKKHGLQEVLVGADEAFDAYLEYSKGKPTADSWEKAFAKIGAVLNVRAQSKDRPYLQRLYYVQGILRRRSRNKWLRCVDALESLHKDGLQIDRIEEIAKRSDDWDDFVAVAEAALKKALEDEAYFR